MKTKETELNVDFIGSQEPLSAAEEKALHDFFKKRKLAASKSAQVKKKSRTKRVKVDA